MIQYQEPWYTSFYYNLLPPIVPIKNWVGIAKRSPTRRIDRRKTCSMSGDRLAMLHERGQAHRRSMRPRLKSFWLP